MAITVASSLHRLENCSALLLGVAAALLFASCGGGTPIDWSQVGGDPGFINKDAWIPYVDEVAFPATIYTGEEFAVKLKLSAEAFPDCLDGGKYHFFIGPQYLPPVGNNSYEVMPWSFRNESAGPFWEAEAEPVFTIPGLPAGEWVIGVDSAVSPELGGSKVRFNVIPGLAAFPDPAWEIRYYTITVVERPGDG